MGRIIFRVWLEIEESEIVYYVVTLTCVRNVYEIEIHIIEIAYPFIHRSILRNILREETTEYNIQCEGNQYLKFLMSRPPY